jgi:hypothetical protein
LTSIRKDEKKSEGFSSKEIQENFREESKGKLKPGQAPALSYARSRRNLTAALDCGRLDLYLHALDAMGFVEGTPQREQALRVFNNKHGPYSR